ncbi:hypothetical protein SUDANB176_00803 [Streptomyces sp. enrichment culture]|uniref:DUF7916 family protein n=1 Tax=Streptomyces sp. enrichment culture TaxID=1795815 RepID=UPI003F542947
MSDGILDLGAEQLPELRGKELTTSVRAASGRTLLVRAPADGTFAGRAHALQIARAFGADVLVLDSVQGVWDGDTWNFPVLGRYADLHEVAADLGRPVCVVLRSGDVPVPGRATPWNAQRLADQGAAAIWVTDDAATSASYADLARDVSRIRSLVGPEVSLWAGRAPQSGPLGARTGTAGPMRLAEAGADTVFLTAPGPGAGAAAVESAVRAARMLQRAGALVAVTGRAESEPVNTPGITDTVRAAREMGADAHLLGAGPLGPHLDPELLYHYSLEVRGREFTWRRMAEAGSRKASAYRPRRYDPVLRLPSAG